MESKARADVVLLFEEVGIGLANLEIETDQPDFCHVLLRKVGQIRDAFLEATKSRRAVLEEAEGRLRARAAQVAPVEPVRELEETKADGLTEAADLLREMANQK